MYSSEAAEQVVRMSIQGSEVALKLTGTAAKHLAAMIYTIMKDNQTTAGKSRLVNMLKTGKELKVFTLPADDIKAFAQEAKRYGVLYCVLKERGATKGMVDVMVKEEDASKINRIIEKLSLAAVDAAKVIPDIEKKKDSPEPKNPTTAKPEKSPRLEPISESKETSKRDISDTSRKSVRKTMEDIREERSKGKSGKGKNRERSQGTIRNDEILQQLKSQADRERRYR